MSGDFERRLKAIERKLNVEAARSGKGARLIIGIAGCFTPPDVVPAFANCGERWWLRNPDEELEAFAGRCFNEAPPGEADLIIGGLPRNQEQYDAAMVEYDRWLASDGGVPPMETTVPRRRGFA